MSHRLRPALRRLLLLAVALFLLGCPYGSEFPLGDPAAGGIDGERFLSVKDEAWFLLNYRLSEGTLRLRLVDDALFESRRFASPEELRSFLRAHLADPLLYDGEAQWDWELERAGAAPRPATAP